MHELFHDFPADLFALMIALPVAMAAAAITLGWKARAAALHRRRMGEEDGKGPGEDALAAGITVAVVPLAFALLMLWARFG